MEEKKKFEKPLMQVVMLRSKNQLLAGSGCDDNPWCGPYGEPCDFDYCDPDCACVSGHE